MKVAVVGCCHGELDIIYSTIQETEGSVDLVLISGDFQAIRHRADLAAMSCPDKYKVMGDFHHYFDGSKRAPFPTIFIGGNHESSEYMLEMKDGGWLCPNIYFLGRAGMVIFHGLRIAGVSGIYNDRDYPERHWERVPLQGNDVRTVYHYRYEDMLQLSLLCKRPDVFISHDWPAGIWEYGNKAELLRRKPFFRADMNSGRLGSAPLRYILAQLSPRYWFSAHLHVKFPATIPHSDGSVTEFLALDKCLSGRKFLEILNVPVADESKDFYLEAEWIRGARAFYRTIEHVAPADQQFVNRFYEYLELECLGSNFNLLCGEADIDSLNQQIRGLYRLDVTSNPEELDI